MPSKSTGGCVVSSEIVGDGVGVTVGIGGVGGTGAPGGVGVTVGIGGVGGTGAPGGVGGVGPTGCGGTACTF